MREFRKFSIFIHTCKNYIIILFLCSFGYQTFGQISKSNFKPLSINYSINEGLPSNECYQVFQDSKKRIWVATDFGVSLFNAGTFINFTSEDGLIDETILEFYEDYKGNIWFLSTSKELCFYDGKSIIPYKFNNRITKNISNSSIPDKSIIIDKNDVLFYSLRHVGVFKIENNGKISRYSKNANSINILSVDGKRIWDTWHHFIREEIYMNINVIEGSKATKIGNVLYTGKICLDRSRTLLITEGTVFNVEKKCEIFKGNGLISGSIHDGYAYFGTRSSGLLKYNLSSGLVEDTFLLNKSVTSCEFDQQGGMWCTTLQSGLYYFPKNGYSMIRTSRENYWVSDVEYYNNKLYIGLLESRWIEFGTSAKLNESPSGGHTRFYKSDFGLARMGKFGFYLNDNFIDHIWANSFWSDSNEIIFGASDIYSLKRDGRKEMLYDFFKDTVFNGKFITTAILKDKDKIWLGSKQGLYYIKNKRVFTISNSKEYRGVNILASNKKWGRILESSKKGLLFFNYSGELIQSDPRVKKIGRKIIDLIIDKNNRLIVATEKGLFVLTKKGDEITIFSLDRSDLFNENQTSSLALMDGELVIGTVHGLYKINYLNAIKVKLSNQIELIKIENTSKNGKVASFKNGNNFDYNSNIKIDFNSTDFEAKPFFRYRLNKNEDWIETSGTSILINNIREGSFVLEVCQEKSNGLWSDPKIILEFNVNTPFWKTLWFISFSVVFGVILLLIGGLLLGRRRIRKLEIKNRMLLAEHSALKAQMNPHFFYNILNSIQSRIMHNENEIALEYLARFSKMSRMMIGNSRNSFHSLREEIEFLTQYLELENLRFKNNFQWEINSENVVQIMHLEVPSMIIQPILENAIQHGFKNDRLNNSLLIEMNQVDENTLAVRILDNGSGYFPEKKKKKSIALTIIKERLNLMSDSNNEYTIEIEPIIINDEIGGTRVLVLLPLKNREEIEEI